MSVKLLNVRYASACRDSELIALKLNCLPLFRSYVFHPRRLLAQFTTS